MMKRVFPLILLLLPLAGCAHHDAPPHKTNSYVEWQRQKDADDDHRFFYGGWWNPNANEPDSHTAPKPSWM
jgi:hypothetical protein